MTMTIDLKPEVAARVRAAAERQGVDPETLAAQVLEAGVPPDPMQRVLWNGMTVEQWQEEARSFVESNRGLPTLPPEAFERSSFYEDGR